MKRSKENIENIVLNVFREDIDLMKNKNLNEE